MAKTSEKVTDAAANVKPYLDRALYDAELRESVRSAYESARAIYDELLGNRGVTGIATRVASDKEMQDELRSAISDLRRASDRVRGIETERRATPACCSSASCSGFSSTRSPGRRPGSGCPTA